MHDFQWINNVNFAALFLGAYSETARDKKLALSVEKPIVIGLSNSLHRPFTGERKNVTQANCIFTFLKKHTIVIDATLLKCQMKVGNFTLLFT
jgi:hypothetical protein